MERRATGASAAEEVCLMTCELAMIHSVGEAEVYTEDQIDDFFAEQLALHQSLIIRGWVWKMSAEYQNFARGYIKCGILEDGD